MNAAILAAAAAIANARAGRRGAPPIINVLDILPPRLHAEVTEDAQAALDAAGAPALVASLKEMIDCYGSDDGGGPIEIIERAKAAVAGYEAAR